MNIIPLLQKNVTVEEDLKSLRIDDTPCHNPFSWLHNFFYFFFFNAVIALGYVSLLTHILIFSLAYEEHGIAYQY